MKNTIGILYFCFCFSFYFTNVSGDVILEPTKSGSTEIALIMIQGANIAPSQYEDVAKMIQDALPYSTWVGIPNFPFNIPNPLGMSWKIPKIIDTMKDMGMETSTIFFSGHSLGGELIQNYVFSNSDLATGQILMGAALNRKYNDSQFPVPTLTIGSELDGLMRITRVAEGFYNQIEVKSNQTEAALQFPVIVLEGANHMQFASGDAPQFVKDNDLIPEISDNEAHTLIAQDITNFIMSLLGNTDSINYILDRVDTSNNFFSPIITALLEEGYHNFKKPCYCTTDVCDSKPDCYGGCPWSNKAMSIMGSGLDYVTINSRDSFHPVWEIQANGSDPVHLPEVINQCESPDVSCELNMTTITQAVYEKLDKLDTGFYPITAKELRIKMNSRQAVWIAAAQSNVLFNETDNDYNCAEINQMSYNWAFETASDSTINRFNEYGEPYIMGKDIAYSAGPTWIWNSLDYDESLDQSNVTITSPTLKTDVDYIIHSASGFHYCKVLSPARAIEWLYVDGLRAHYSLKSQSLNNEK